MRNSNSPPSYGQAPQGQQPMQGMGGLGQMARMVAGRMGMQQPQMGNPQPQMGNPQPQQPQGAPQQTPPQQQPVTGMAGLGQVARKGFDQLMQARALRRGGGGGMPANTQEM
jgi:hypothetical protein